MTAGRSYVVTGAARGVGRAIAERLAAEAHVVVLDPSPADGWGGATVEHLQADAGDPAAAREAAARAEANGELAGWVNNAAIFDDGGFASHTADDLAALVSANIRLALVGCHTAVTHFLDRGRPGAIVNVSSHQAQRPVRGALPYATAKAAIEGLTRAAAVDHGPQGIRVNAVALGSIRTARYDAYRADHPEVDAQMAELHPLGRVGEAAEVAAAVHFLLSPAASFISGAIVPVDGGRSALGPDPEAR